MWSFEMINMNKKLPIFAEDRMHWTQKLVAGTTRKRDINVCPELSRYFLTYVF